MSTSKARYFKWTENPLRFGKARHMPEWMIRSDGKSWDKVSKKDEVRFLKSNDKTCKMNVVNRGGRSYPECTNCGHRFDTRYAKNGYGEMCRVAMGKFTFCPVCGAKYTGCQIEGVDFDECEVDKRDWILRGLGS